MKYGFVAALALVGAGAFVATRPSTGSNLEVRGMAIELYSCVLRMSNVVVRWRRWQTYYDLLHARSTVLSVDVRNESLLS